MIIMDYGTFTLWRIGFKGTMDLKYLIVNI